MNKCPKCGAEAYGFIDASGAGIYKCGSTDHGFDPEHPEPFVSVLCLRRQLAAANERVAKLEAALCCDTPYRDQASELAKLRAQMVELREAWPDIVLATMLDETDEEKAASVTFHHILGGA